MGSGSYHVVIEHGGGKAPVAASAPAELLSENKLDSIPGRVNDLRGMLGTA